jgi:hypothetical protein
MIDLGEAIVLQETCHEARIGAKQSQKSERFRIEGSKELVVVICLGRRWMQQCPQMCPRPK